VGGAETYLSRVIGGLRPAGNKIALFCEIDAPGDREPINLPDDSPMWCAEKIGSAAAIDALRQWHPDVIYGHGLSDADVEAATVEAAPAVFFAHGYYGTCISGAKTFKYHDVHPCDRRFGWQCLMHFYPHRCGGLNPLTMLHDFRRQTRRLVTLRKYRAIVTASEHMREEYLRHGFVAQTVKVVPYPIDCEPTPVISGIERKSERLSRLLFVGRMEELKGGSVLLDALPDVHRVIGRPLHVAFVGDGSQRKKWEAKAARLQAREPGLNIEFTGWLQGAELRRAWYASDLLVVPSLWPEPFGLIGPEAAAYGLPAVGFDVGGISEWLRDGISGFLASGNPPTASGLAAAIVRSLIDPSEYVRLCQGAMQCAQSFSLGRHTAALLKIFSDTVLTVGTVSRLQQQLSLSEVNE
jgi:glycosyltransferase involved in cell wall biosynthesis